MAGSDYNSTMGMNASSTRGKQDLLLHLLANLPQSILLLGTQGTGKTALLRQIQGRMHDNWRVCALQGSANLSFERVIEEMAISLPRSASTAGNSEERLDEQLRQLGQLPGRLVLLLDDAGLLIPGLLAAICQFVRLHPEIRLVFALRPEELAAKSATDALALADAHTVRLDDAGDTSAPLPQTQPMAPKARLENQNPAPAGKSPLKIPGKPVYWLIGGGLIAAVVSGAWVGSRWQPSSPTPASGHNMAKTAQDAASPVPAASPVTPAPAASPQTEAVMPSAVIPQAAAEKPVEPQPTPPPAPSPTPAPSPSPTATAEPTPTPSPTPTAKPTPKKPAIAVTPKASAAPKHALETAKPQATKTLEAKPSALPTVKPKPSAAPKQKEEKPVSLRKLLDEMDKP